MRTRKLISPQVINRLPKYLKLLESMRAQGQERTSSTQLANHLGSTASQIRQDLSMFGTYGATGYSYSTDTLIREIRNILGISQPHHIVAIGVGSIGRALLEHMNFRKYNHHVSAAFDNDPKLIGTIINGVPVYDIAKLPAYLDSHEVDICMLTVSASAAKSIAKELYRLGIPAIWNFTNVDLGLDESQIIVQNVSFPDSLLVLTYYLEQSQPVCSVLKVQAG